VAAGPYIQRVLYVTLFNRDRRTTAKGPLQWTISQLSGGERASSGGNRAVLRTPLERRAATDSDVTCYNRFDEH